MHEARNWYVLQGGKWDGPMGRDDIHELVRAGKLRGSDLVAQEGMQAGIRAADAGFVQPPQAPRPGGDADADLAPLGRRFGAATIDMLISLAFQVPSIALLVGAVAAAGPQGDPGVLGWLAMSSFVIMGMLSLALQGYLITTSGRSLGKRVLHIRIVKQEDGNPPGFVRGVLIREVLNWFFKWGLLYGPADVLFVLGERRECLHDRIAGTRVVNVRGS
jgi:uncharacterized RDD family membrane protein YckC